MSHIQHLVQCRELYSSLYKDSDARVTEVFSIRRMLDSHPQYGYTVGTFGHTYPIQIAIYMLCNVNLELGK